MRDLRVAAMMLAGYLFAQAKPECEAMAMPLTPQSSASGRSDGREVPSRDTVHSHDLLTLGRAVAHETGQFLLHNRPQILQTETKSSPTDVVTEMDQAAEKRIISAILKERPLDGYLGEEGALQPGSSGVTWIIDPIDGTTNFLYRIPMWAVSIAAAIDGEVVAGVVDAPALGVQYFGHHGGGAWTVCGPDAQPTVLICSSASELSQSLVATGFGYDIAQREKQAHVVTHVLPRVRDLRRAGAASIDLCWVAAGLVDAYYENGLQPWDFAAGALIAQEAGAHVSDLHGGPPGSGTTIAVAPGIRKALQELLIGCGA